MKFFISYTMRDSEINKNLLIELSARLKKYGKVFIDLIDNKSENRQERVIKELDTCDFLVLLETKSIYLSKWVEIEIERAKKRAIPILRFSLDSFMENDKIEISNMINNKNGVIQEKAQLLTKNIVHAAISCKYES